MSACSSSSSSSSSSFSFSASSCLSRHQLRWCVLSVPCRTSTAIMWAQCSVPDLNMQRSGEFSVPRRTSTAIPWVQCSAPDLNRDPVSSVFRAGPQPRSCEASVPRRTSTAILWVQCSAPDLNRDPVRPVFRAGPQPRQDVRKNVKRYVRKNVRQNVSKYVRKNVSRYRQNPKSHQFYDFVGISLGRACKGGRIRSLVYIVFCYIFWLFIYIYTYIYIYILKINAVTVGAVGAWVALGDWKSRVLKWLFGVFTLCSLLELSGS